MEAPFSLASSTSFLQMEKLASLLGVAVNWHIAARGGGDVDILHRLLHVIDYIVENRSTN